MQLVQVQYELQTLCRALAANGSTVSVMNMVTERLGAKAAGVVTVRSTTRDTATADCQYMEKISRGPATGDPMLSFAQRVAADARWF